MLITTAFASCSNESEDLNSLPGNHLDIQVGIQETANSRAVITGNNLIDGSLVGVTVVDATGTAYQGQDYNNVCYTAATVDGKQQWTPSKDVTLSGEPATLYAYYPWTDGVDVSAIPVDMTENGQTDWMYATPVEGLNDANATAQVKLHHALANVKLTLYKDSYSGAGEVTAFSVQSDGAATGGTLNAKTGTFTETVNDGQAITRTLAYTLTDKASATPFDCMVVPTGEEAAMTVTVTVDGHTYSSTTDAFTLAKATAYNLALKLTSTGLSVTSVSLTDWSEEPLPDADFEPVISDPWANVSNGVYAVAADGSPVEIANATSECVAVALIQGPHKFMIEKNEYLNNSYKKAYEGAGGEYDGSSVGYRYFHMGGYGINLDGITDYEKVQTLGYMNTFGYLPNENGDYDFHDDYFYIDGNYQNWTGESALADFNGKQNTAVIQTVTTLGSGTLLYTYVSSLLKTFNHIDNDENLGYTDWYIPAAGQLSLIYMNLASIENVLSKINGLAFDRNSYWTSTEKNAEKIWQISFGSGSLEGRDKSSSSRIRFIRNL